MTGVSRSIWRWGSTRAVPALVDSAPMSTRSAPWAAMIRPRLIAEAADVATLSR